MGTAVMKAASDRTIKTALLMISPLSLKHLARQRSLWQGALVSQQPQSFGVCFAALLGQSGKSAITVESAGADAAKARPIGASVTLTAISNASRKRCTAKATSGRHYPQDRGSGSSQPFQGWLQFYVSLIANPSITPSRFIRLKRTLTVLNVQIPPETDLLHRRHSVPSPTPAPRTDD